MFHFLGAGLKRARGWSRKTQPRSGIFKQHSKCVVLDRLTHAQADDLDVPEEGPYKPEYFR
jgi:hypothetical protein